MSLGQPLTREQRLTRLVTLLCEVAPGLGGRPIGETDRLDALGLDSLALSALFAKLRAELPVPIDAIAWYDALDAGDSRVGVLLDLMDDVLAGQPA